MRNLLFSLIFITLVNCQNDRFGGESKIQDNQITIGIRDSLHSEVLGETRNILVHVPNNAINPDSNQVKYPVLYLLDGDGHFYSVTGMIRQLSTVNGNTICPQMIIVGIPNTDRTRDLTPSHVDVAFGDSTWVKTSGGGDNFLSFIRNELIPYVESKYPASKYRTFVGHSLGGLTIVNTLIKQPDLFSNYISIDPSMWWDNQLLCNEADSVLKSNRFDGKSLYIGVANTIPEENNFNTILEDTSQNTYHIRSILRFIDVVKREEDNGLNCSWKYYENDDHGSVPLISEYDALRFMFSWYRLKGLDVFFRPDQNTTAEHLLEKITSHYALVSAKFGYQVLPDEANINSMGYAFMQSNMPEKAFAMFDLNIKNFPQSANVYDSMGDYYVSQSDTINAIKYFSKAVEMWDNQQSREKLDALKGG